MEKNGVQMEIRFGWMMLIILPLLQQMEEMVCGNTIMKGLKNQYRIGFLTKPDIETITGIGTARKKQLLEGYFLRSHITFLWSLILGCTINFGCCSTIKKPLTLQYEES
jgi:hypothetical protein